MKSLSIGLGIIAVIGAASAYGACDNPATLNPITGQFNCGSGTSGGGATIPDTADLISGDGAGNGADSGIVPASVVLLSATQTLTNKSISADQINSGVLVIARGGWGPLNAGSHTLFGNSGSGSSVPFFTALPVVTDITAQIFGQNVASPIASATTIAPLMGIFHITGTAAIATITPPPLVMTSTIGGCLTVIADGAWTTTTAGNIFATMTAVPGTPYQFCYDGSKWYTK